MNTRSPQPDDLYNFRLISDAQITPDGSRVAFVLRRMDKKKDEYISNIHVVDRQGAVVQFTSGDKDSTPRWSPDGTRLAFLSGRKEEEQIYVLNASGGEGVAMTSRKLGAGEPVWSPDSSAIAFAAIVSTDPEEEQEDEEGEKAKPKKTPTKIMTRTSYKADGVGYIGNRRRHIFLLELSDRSVKQLTEGDFNDSRPAWSPDSRYLTFDSKRAKRWDLTAETDIYLLPREGGEAHQLTSGGSYFTPVFSPDGSRIAFAGQDDPRELFAPARLHSIARDGADLRDEQGAWDGNLSDEVNGDVVVPSEEVFLHWKKDGLYFLGTERGVVNVYRTRDVSVEAMTHGRHTLTDYSINCHGAIAYTRSDATHPAEIFLQSGGRVLQLTHENDALMEEIGVITPERFSFTGADGEESEGWLLAPAGSESGKHPLLVYLHGGPLTAYGEVYFFEYQLLAAQGFGVFFPNIHGSSSYGHAYQTSIWRDWGNKDFIDVMAGSKEAMSRPWVDPERVGVIGGSYGGFMTLWALSHSDVFRAGVAERALSNWISFIGTSDGGWIWDRMTGVYPEQDVQKLWDMSPQKYLADIHVPVMVIHSEWDDRTPIEQGEQVFNTLRRLGNDTKFVRFPEESHGLSRIGKPSRRIERFEHIMAWFREKL